MHVEQSGRVVIDESALWRPVEDRSFALKTEDRSGLGRRRWSAAVVDNLLLMVPLGLVTALAGVGGSLVAIALWLSYDFLCEALAGQTVGKRVYGLRVVRKDGAPLNLAAVATRNVLRLIEAPWGWIFFLTTRGRQRFGDVVAGTVVTRVDGYRHIPASERFRTTVLVGYPLCWIAASIVAAWFAAGQAENDRYMQLANLTCVRAGAALNANPQAGIAEMHHTVVDIERSLRTLEPPASMAAAHQRLVTAVHRERALLGRAVHLKGRALRRAGREYTALTRRDAVQARADGFPGCA
jgi:uncharacterized RDD family membrane protein YckC